MLEVIVQCWTMLKWFYQNASLEGRIDIKTPIQHCLADESESQPLLSDCITWCSRNPDKARVDHARAFQLQELLGRVLSAKSFSSASRVAVAAAERPQTQAIISRRIFQKPRRANVQSFRSGKTRTELPIPLKVEPSEVAVVRLPFLAMLDTLTHTNTLQNARFKKRTLNIQKCISNWSRVDHEYSSLYQTTCGRSQIITLFLEQNMEKHETLCNYRVRCRW